MRGNQSWSEEELELLQGLVAANSPKERYGYWIDIAELFEEARVRRGLSSERRGKEAIRKKWARSQNPGEAVSAPIQEAGSTTQT